MSHVYLHIEVIVIKNIRYINFTYDKTYDTIINENMQEWMQFYAVIQFFQNEKAHHTMISHSRKEFSNE